MKFGASSITGKPFVEFKSDSHFYELEQEGVKPNTLRVVEAGDLLRLGGCRHISIKNTSTGRSFIRDIESFVDVTQAMQSCGVRVPVGSHLVLICWSHPEGKVEK